jgi:hypothetical protein
MILDPAKTFNRELFQELIAVDGDASVVPASRKRTDCR